MEKIFAPQKNRQLIQGWLIHARKSWKKQEEAARRLESQYRRVGLASIILSAVVGASLFASLETMYEPWGRIIAGIVSIAASVLASLLTFNRYEERTEKHRSAGVSYKATLRKLEKLHAVPTSAKTEQESLSRVEEEFAELEKLVPVVPEDINRAVEQQHEVYRFVANPTDLRLGPDERE
jgi:hypothetical protein